MLVIYVRIAVLLFTKNAIIVILSGILYYLIASIAETRKKLPFSSDGKFCKMLAICFATSVLSLNVANRNMK